MGLLCIKNEHGYENWNTGSARCGYRFLPPHRVTLGVNCRVSDFEEDSIALLDTGATYSLIGGELASELKAQCVCLGPATLRTRYGKMKGDLIRISITLLADRYGSDLEVDSTIMVCEEWPGPPIVLGYIGFLERIRIGIDPGISHEDPILYFARAG